MKKAGLFIALLLGCAFHTVSAQQYGQTARAFVAAPQALGMGDAAVAFPTEQTVFFYNPAHAAHVAGVRPRINFLGVRGSITNNVFDQVAFIRDELQPALDEGIDTMPAEEVEALYNEAFALGHARTTSSVDVLLPSVLVRIGGVGVGAGLFAHTKVRYHVVDGGGGIPLLDAVGQGDAIGVVSAGIDFSRYGLAGLSAGLTAKYTRRYLSVKAKTLDEHRWTEELGYHESYHLLRGTSAGFDLGVLYDVPVPAIPGKVRLGLAVYDLVASDFDYTYDRTLAYEEHATQDGIDRDIGLANQRYALHPSHRFGVAYTLPRLLGLLDGTGIAIDYVGYTQPRFDQAFATQLHLGAQTQVAGILALRAGLSQGYTSVGAGLDLTFVRLDYDFYGVEEGRIPGQLPSWNHTVQLAFGLF